MALPNRKQSEPPSLPVPATPEETRKLFAEIVKKEGGASNVALRLNCSSDTIEKIIDGTRGVGMRRARAIQELYSVKMEWWVPVPVVETVQRIVGR